MLRNCASRYKLFVYSFYERKLTRNVYKYINNFFLLESLYNYLYLGLLLQDACKLCVYFTRVTKKKIYVLRKKTHNERR